MVSMFVRSSILLTDLKDSILPESQRYNANMICYYKLLQPISSDSLIFFRSRISKWDTHTLRFNAT